MIIGVNGRMGSGKDTVGKIIQYLQCHNTGEITIEDVISNPEHEWWLEEQSNFEIKKFAAKLKTVASLLTGIPVDKFEDQEFKKTNLPDEWCTLQQSGRNKVFLPMTVRELLQKLGTEAMRDGLHTDVWINALFADYKPQGARRYKYLGSLLEDKHHGLLNNPNWIITDMRFPNEMEAVVKKGGITIRVVRDNWKPNAGDTILIKVFSNWSTVTYTHTDSEGNHFGVGTDGYNYKSPQIKQSNLHPSETALDDAKFDYEIINDGSIEDLVEKVREILTRENII